MDRRHDGQRRVVQGVQSEYAGQPREANTEARWSDLSHPQRSATAWPTRSSCNFYADGFLEYPEAIRIVFADLTQDCVRAGSFRTVSELVDEITAYLVHRNENPKPYQWKADGAETLAKIHRAREALAEASSVM
ncbi:MAG: hypothetical protein OXH69_04170 [Acidobacteria bacterium]|nr:hypothetical protein [Acidobacteriota bacterium]